MDKEFTVLRNSLKDLGIQIRHSCPYTHQQNGLVEWKHQHITETGLTLLAQSGLPMTFWWNLFHTETFLINRLPTPVLHNQSPYFKLFGKEPDYTSLQNFGYACYPFLWPYNTSKLHFRTSKCLFLGYSDDHRGYKCLHSSGRLYISNTVEFHEHEFPFSDLFPSQSSSSISSSQQHMFNPPDASLYHIIIPSPPTSTGTMASHTSSPSSKSSSPIYSPLHLSDYSSGSRPVIFSSTTLPPPVINNQPMITRSKSGSYKPRVFKTEFLNREPDSVSEALRCSQWKNAMVEEYNALHNKDTWDLVPRTEHMNVISTKWIFRTI